MTTNALFITGTDTHVGKTFVTCGIANKLRENDKQVGVMKPVETGCWNGTTRHPEDAAAIAKAAGCTAPLTTICPYQFDAPVAPDIAARLEGVHIDSQMLCSTFEQIAGCHDVTLVEGAGGFLVPIKERYLMADLVQDFNIPTVVVVASKLGAINHTLLTLEAAAARNITVRGYILNHVSNATDVATTTNADLLSRCTDIPCLGEIAYTPPAHNNSSQVVKAALNWQTMWQD